MSLDSQSFHPENVWIAYVGIAAFLGATIVGIVLWMRTQQFLARSILTTGQYIDANWEFSTLSGQSAQYGSIAFQTSDGQWHTFKGRVGTPAESRKIGRSVGVRYDPQNPQNALVDTFIEIWMPVVIFLGVGVLGTLASVIGVIVIRSLS